MTHERRVFFDISRHITSSGELTLPEEARRYLFSVLRIKVGDEVIVGDLAYSALTLRPTDTLPKIYRTKATSENTLAILSATEVREPSHPVCYIAPALAKGDTNDIIIEKSVELGISQIAIWSSNRSIPSLRNQTDIDKKVQRWRKIAIAAAQQSGRAMVPDVTFFTSASQLLSYLIEQSIEINHSILLCSLASNAIPVATLYEKLPTFEEQAPHFSVIIGPEGDFTPEEESLFLEAKVLAVSLGQRRLKVDTAAISAIAMLDVLFSQRYNDYNKAE